MTDNSEFTHYIVIKQNAAKEKDIKEAMWTLIGQETRADFGNVICEEGGNVRIPFGLKENYIDLVNSDMILDKIAGSLRRQLGCVAPELWLEKIDS